MSSLLPTDPEHKRRVSIALELADLAAKETLPRFRAEHGERNKQDSGPYDPVTEADTRAEEVMREHLAKVAPDDGVNGEEFGIKDGKSGWTWYLDPVDGTRAFVAGLPSWTTLIACVQDETPLIGIIDQPYLGERYVGWTDGAFLDSSTGRTALSVSGKDRLTDAILSTTDPFILTPSERGAFEHLRATARLTRYGLDAYAYARLAAGTIDIVTEGGLQPHDVAALIPVVRGAGGLATTWRGQEAKLGAQIVCAASQEILEQALISLRRSAL